MRAGARDVLRINEGALDTVFGARKSDGDSPWAWDSAYPEDGSWRDVARATRVRIAVDDSTGSAKPDHIQIGELMWPSAGLCAEFTVTRAGYLEPSARPRHEAVLRLAARAVTALGTQRRRGLGWISIRPAGTAGQIAAATDLALVRAAEDR